MIEIDPPNGDGDEPELYSLLQHGSATGRMKSHSVSAAFGELRREPMRAFTLFDWLRRRSAVAPLAVAAGPKTVN